MGIKHKAPKASGQEGFATEWNDEHKIDSDVDYAGHSGVNLGEPVAPSDIATKNYVDTRGVGGIGAFSVANITDGTEYSVFAYGNAGWHEIHNYGNLITNSVHSGIYYVRWSGRAKTSIRYSYANFRIRIVGQNNGITFTSNTFDFNRDWGASVDNTYYSFEEIILVAGASFYDTEYAFIVDGEFYGTSSDGTLYIDNINFTITYID